MSRSLPLAKSWVAQTTSARIRQVPSPTTRWRSYACGLAVTFKFQFNLGSPRFRWTNLDSLNRPWICFPLPFPATPPINADLLILPWSTCLTALMYRSRASWLSISAQRRDSFVSRSLPGASACQQSHRAMVSKVMTREFKSRERQKLFAVLVPTTSINMDSVSPVTTLYSRPSPTTSRPTQRMRFVP